MAKTANSNTTCTLQLSSKNQKPNENRFEVTLIEAIDESLGSFKSLNKQEIYSHLENAFGIKKQEIPCKIEEFADAMEQMFGIGARLIEIRIIEAIHKRIPDYVFTPRKGAVFFKEYVASLHTFSLNLYS
jgi:hypothetical protein